MIFLSERCLELPGNFGYSELRFYHDKYKGLPKSFAWMTGNSVDGIIIVVVIMAILNVIVRISKINCYKVHL